MTQFRAKTIFCFIAILSLCGCELAYEPSLRGDTSSSPSSMAEQQFVYKETVPPHFTAEELKETMPLERLLDIALSNNPTTRASWNAARAAAFGYHVSLSEYYPALNYSGYIEDQYVHTDATSTVPATSAQSWSVFNELTLSYLVLDFGGRYGQASLAYHTFIQANWQHNLVMQQVMISVINAYTSHISNKALVVAAEQDFHDAETTLQAALKMKQWGVATQTDVLTAQANVEQMRLNWEQAKGAEKTSAAQLLIALGLPVNTGISVEGLPDKLPVVKISGDVNSLIELAKQRRPDIGAAISQVKEQEAELMISFSAGMPVLTLTGITDKTHYLKAKTPLIDNSNSYIALNVNVPIFDGFYYVNQQKQIRAQIAEAIANLDAQVAQVVSEVVVNYYAFTTAEAGLASSEALLEYSTRSYRGYLSQYKVGSASILDVLNSLTILSNARAQQIATRTQWAYSLANLAFSVGTLGDDSGNWEEKPPEILYKLKYKDNK